MRNVDVHKGEGGWSDVDTCGQGEEGRKTSFFVNVIYGRSLNGAAVTLDLLLIWGHVCCELNLSLWKLFTLQLFVLAQTGIWVRFKLWC